MNNIALFLVLIFTLPATLAFSQVDLGGGLGGGIGGDGGGLGGLGGLGGDGGIGGDGGDGGVGGGLDLGGVGVDTMDERNQGFVGATSAQIQDTGFIGASSETSGPPVTDGASFGGGVNDSGIQAGGGGGGGFGGAGGGGPGGVNGGFGGAGPLGGGTENGFQVMRRSVRARLVPQINVRPVPNAQIASRFQNRLSRQPAPQLSGPPFPNQAFTSTAAPSVNVQIENRTAILTGFVNSTAERDRWERQLRLEPGVYRIVNQIEVTSSFSSPVR